MEQEHHGQRSDPAGPVAIPFPAGYRASGILLHVTALPSPYGIGDLGPGACRWIDRLAEAGQSWWQVLPLGPTGERNSPYEPQSSFAGNPLLLSPDWLVEQGLITAEDTAGPPFPDEWVDYERVIPFKRRLLDAAWGRFQAGADSGLTSQFESFCCAQAKWLDDFALFAALKERYGDLRYPDWPEPLACREPAALEAARSELTPAMQVMQFGQFLCAGQWRRLREHARSRGVRLMGDLPIFVSIDSADAWAHRELFLLDERCRPMALAGVPPDYFSQEGQLWGNPLYDWEALRQTGYRWWIERLRSQTDWLDLVRLDHFRAFEAAWHVRTGATTARDGEWRPGPRDPFFDAVRGALGGLPFVAEDLGLITDEVRALRDRWGLPGMRVLQFAFEGDATNPFLPHNYVSNTVVYTGTHDNDTSRGWYESLPPERRATVDAYLSHLHSACGDPAWELIALAWESAAALAITTLQDLHSLGASARFNRPGEADGNWRWRATGELLPEDLAGRLHELTERTGRLPAGGGR